MGVVGRDRAVGVDAGFDAFVERGGCDGEGKEKGGVEWDAHGERLE